MTQIMKVRWVVGWVVVFMLVAAIGYAQQPRSPSRPAAAASATAPEPPALTLSLAQALEIARQNSPDYRQVLNNRWSASMQSTSSALELFLPSVSLNGNRNYSASGQRSFGAGFPAQPYPAVTSYNWSVGMNYSLSGTTIANRGLAAANLRATEQDISGALTLLESNVRTQYLQVLASQAQAALSRRALERVGEQLNLARAKYSVGQGTLIDVRSSEVSNGQAEVNELKADQAVENDILKLYGVLGVPAPEPLRLELTDSFPVSAPPWTQQQLIDLALAQNPALLALRARRESAAWSTRAARSTFLPSFFFSAGKGGYRQVADTVTTSGTNPISFTIGASLPIFEPLSRNVAVEQARANQDDLAQLIRANELSVRSGVTAAFHTLLADYRTIDLQRANKAAAAEALDLATQRYRVGSGSYLELLTARDAADKADADYVTAIYDYHKAIATLENAVGRPLR